MADSLPCHPLVADDLKTATGWYDEFLSIWATAFGVLLTLGSMLLNFARSRSDAFRTNCAPLVWMGFRTSSSFNTMEESLRFSAFSIRPLIHRNGADEYVEVGGWLGSNLRAAVI